MAVKTITINDKDVKFMVSGATPIRYMSMYGKDFLAEFIKLEKEISSGNIADFMPVYRIIYCLAKQADSNIDEMEDWLESFEDGLPVFDVLTELFPLIQLNLASTNVGKPQTRKKK